MRPAALRKSPAAPGSLALHGHPGFSPAEAKTFARAQLKLTVQRGAVSQLLPKGTIKAL